MHECDHDRREERNARGCDASSASVRSGWCEMHGLAVAVARGFETRGKMPPSGGDDGGEEAQQAEVEDRATANAMTGQRRSDSSRDVQ